MTKPVFPFLLTLIVFFTSLPALQAKPLPKAQAEAFLDSIVQGDVDKAYNTIFKDTSTQRMKPQDLEMVKAQTRAGLPMYGKTEGWEMISESQYGERLVKYKYVLYTPTAPIVWIFHFYRVNGTQWDLYNIYFDDKVHSLDR